MQQWNSQYFWFKYVILYCKESSLCEDNILLSIHTCILCLTCLWFNLGTCACTSAGLCHVLLDGALINDIISLLSDHKLFTDDEIIALKLAPSDHLKKIFLSRKFQQSDLTEWSTICTILRDSQQSKYIGDVLVSGKLVFIACTHVLKVLRQSVFNDIIL